MKRKGFTLIELLVVIAIIAILAAILFPVFAQAREKARSISCMSNCKQIGTALQVYSQDYDEGFPTWSQYWYCAANPVSLVPCRANPGLDTRDRYWDQVLLPYVKSGAPASGDWGGVWKCPSSERQSNFRSMGISMGYTYDSLPTSPWFYRYLTQAQIDKPASTIFVGDGGSAGRLGRTFDYQGYYEKFVARVPYTRDAPWRHQEGGNYVFLDGHAKNYKGDAVYPHPTPPSTAYSTANPRAWCAHAQYFAPTAEERDYFGNRARNAGNAGCTW